MIIQCFDCFKKVDTMLIDKESGAYFNSKKQIVCYKCMKKEEFENEWEEHEK